MTEEWQTAYGRSMLDFDVLLRGEAVGRFTDKEALERLFAEQKRLSRASQIAYLVSFAVALIVLLGPLPDGVKVSGAGFEAPLSVVPQQILAVLAAVVFSRYITVTLSLTMLQGMIRRILALEGLEAWHFFASQWNAEMLWPSLIMPRQIGYKSPKRHFFASIGIVLFMLVILMAHTAVVSASMVVALLAAIDTGSWLLIGLGGISLAIVVAAGLGAALCIIFPMPFRLDVNAA